MAQQTEPKTMGKSGGRFQYDGIVFHSEDEEDSAEKFCEQLRKIDLGNGRRLNVVTIEEYSLPGRQRLEIVNSAIDEAEYVYFSYDYYSKDAHGKYYGYVANHSKIPHKFIVLQTGADCSDLPNVDAACKLRLETDWSITKFVPQKIRELYTGRAGQENQQTEMPDDSFLTVMNPSISSSSNFESLVDTSTAQTCPKRLQDHSRGYTAGQVTDVSSLTDTDLFVDTEQNGEEVEVPEVPVNRVAPQPRPAARSPLDGSETLSWPTPEITDEQREQLRDCL